MHYSIFYGSIFPYLAGSITIFVVFWKKIFVTNAHEERQSDEFYNFLASNVDLSILEKSLEAIELERQRIGIDMHDEMASQLGSLMLDLEVVIGDSTSLSDETTKILMGMRHKVRNSISSLRSVIHGILPDILKNNTLDNSVKELCQKLDGEKGTSVYFRASGKSSVLTDQETLYLFRIVQELLNNCFKHSGAWTIFVSMEWERDKLSINIKDTGTGMSKVPKFINRNNKYGMTGIYARGLTIGAKIKFDSSLSGTEFEITLPINGASSAI